MRVASTVLLGLVALAASAPVSAAQGPVFTTSQTLTPAFNASQIDYLTGCEGGSVDVRAVVPRGMSASVDGRKVAGGTSTTRVKLDPGQRFELTVNASRYSVRCTPRDFPRLSASGKLPKDSPFLAINSLSLLSPSPYSVIVDSRGTPVWWQKAEGATSVANTQPMEGTTIGYWRGDISNGEATETGLFEQVGLDGRSIRQIRTKGGFTDIHEARFLSDGSVYLIADVTRPHVDLRALGGPADAEVVDNVIEQLDGSGNLIWSWSAADHVPVSAAARWYAVVGFTANGGPLDLFHMNSIDVGGDGDLLISMRHTDSVFKVSRSDGSVVWKLGGTASPRSLTVRGDVFPQGSTFGGQHDARFLADGTFTVFDNGSNSVGAAYLHRVPRVTRWRVDPVARRATRVSQLTDPGIPSSIAGGGARMLADGSWVVSWSHRPWIRAYSPQRRLIFSLRNVDGRASYRAVPIAGPAFTRAAFVAGMDARYPR